jgi:hypothetical protein
MSEWSNAEQGYVQQAILKNDRPTSEKRIGV